PPSTPPLSLHDALPISSLGAALEVAISAALLTALSGLESQSGPLSDLFLGRTDNIDIRFAAAIALLFNVLMVVVAIIAIALTVRSEEHTSELQSRFDLV